ncbi:DEAD/DEAH box helicase [Methanobrevibacter sp. 87.7]|uniref:DEAD/DEAH box helicase n=1 Tax=Methanobrevibacter sp. 87.7 TaxID=387957 RepID=UPI0018E9EFB9|nr:DEAD/DEAH box helicase [Methanobrevibacter sp. 87.7]
MYTADSVGLGKTFTALAVIKYYESRNDRVLVLTPKKLRDNWIIYTQNDKRNIFSEDRFNYDVLNHTDLSRDGGKSGDIDLKTINWGNYDLVVIDESHNFRNNPAVNDRETRYQKLMNQIIKGGHKTRLLMLSATPVNNKMTDLKNQIAFITEGNDYALKDFGIDSISNTLRKAQRVFNTLSKMSEEEKTKGDFLGYFDLDYFKLLDTLTIARSRKHIEKYYNLNEVGQFPKRLEPINVKSEIDIEDSFLKLSEINDEISNLNLGIYSPIKYVYPNLREVYENKYDMEVKSGKGHFKQRDREDNVVSLMRVNLLKRMESSIESFRLSISRLLENINNTLELIDNGEFYNQNIDINLIDPEEDEYDDMIFGNNVKVLLQDMDLVKWKEDLNWDKDILINLLNESNKIIPDRDAKLHDLKSKIVEKVNNPINKGNKKVIVFTAFADTAKYLYENISKWALNDLGLHSALITGSNSNKTTLKKYVTNSKDINDILINFSPISKERNHIYPESDEEIDILICTDCISEGQNLQDCDYLINYDIHWNPVRIIQRFGRIDRIGSCNNKIQLVNFWPNMELDEYINLESRVKNKMTMVNISATGEENVISKKQSMNDLDYRRIQLQELQERVIDLEDISNSISITDLNFNDFKVELMNYLKENEQELEKSPKGIYAIINIFDDLIDEIEPGVIFLLKQTSGITEVKERNPLSPYYLIYINENGEVKLNYTKSKKIMDYYKKLCLSKNKVLQDLVKEFELETDDGKDMTNYSSLLSESIENILGVKQEVGVKSLFSKGGTVNVKQDINGLEEFELITFLIIK